MTCLRDRLHELFTVDYDRGTLIWKVAPKYHPRMLGKEAGTPQKNHCEKVYWAVRFDGCRHKRGRIIFAMANGRWPIPCLDHIDGNSENDALINLREASVLQNAWNHKRRSKPSSLPMGVRHQGYGYVARIRCKGKAICLGSFETISAAEQAYRNARKELFGAFA